MATVDDVEVANASFPNVRQDLNDILEAITTNFSADTEPTTTYPNQFWYETDTNLLYIRNEANDAWVTLASINQTSGEWEPRTAVIQAIDSAGIALKTDDGTTRFSISDAGVVSFENYAFPSADGSANQVLATDGSGTLSFTSVASDKIEEGNSSVEVVDTGTGHVAVTTDGSERVRVDSSGNVGIGTNSPSSFYSLADNLVIGTGSGGHGLTIYSGSGDSGYIGFNDTATGSMQGFIQYNHNGDYMAFAPNGSEKARIDSSGNLQFNSGFGSVATAYGCRAWVKLDGRGTASIDGSGNVSSITDNGVGDYTANFATALPDAVYATNVTINNFGSAVYHIASDGSYNALTYSTTAVRVEGSSAFDTVVHISVFR